MHQFNFFKAPLFCVALLMLVTAIKMSIIIILSPMSMTRSWSTELYCSEAKPVTNTDLCIITDTLAQGVYISVCYQNTVRAWVQSTEVVDSMSETPSACFLLIVLLFITLWQPHESISVHRVVAERHSETQSNTTTLSRTASSFRKARLTCSSQTSQ